MEDNAALLAHGPKNHVPPEEMQFISRKFTNDTISSQPKLPIRTASTSCSPFHNVIFTNFILCDILEIHDVPSIV